MFRAKSGQRTRGQVCIQYMSDLHLERIKYEYDVQPAAPHLLLAGDIGNFCAYEQYRDVLARQCQQFERVLLVAGKHEFYRTSREEGLEAADKLVSDTAFDGKLIFLHRGRFDVPDSDVTVLGCTLHSHIGPDYTKLTNDFQYIKGWRVRDHNAEHKRDLQWLQDSLAELSRETPRRKVVVATHYAPAFEKTCHPMSENNELSRCFSSHVLKALKGWQGADLVTHWLFGHTHWNTRFRSGNTLVLSNQLCSSARDLSWWQRRTVYRPFDPKAVIEL
ncbi:hypothetical protein LTR85_008429 [Meristemomyces frigidus]|nr:hypothetical protein LTR85_008429 [Meristemomyces frigidus]